MFTEQISVDNTTINDTAKKDKLFNDDDIIESVEEFLARLKITETVRNKLLEVYTIAASPDNVLSWADAWILHNRTNMFRFKLLEYKNQLRGSDADSLLSGDFDIAVECMAKKLEHRNTRSFEGFERKAGVKNYTYRQ